MPKNDLPPIVSAQQASDSLPPIVSESKELPPIVSASKAQPEIVQASNQESLPPIVSGSALQEPGATLPPVVSANQAITQSNAPLANKAPVVPGKIVSTVKRGAKFPKDAEARIAQFIKANAQPVGNQNSLGGYKTPQSFNGPIVQQNVSTNNLQLQPVPVPMATPNTTTVAPSIGGQAAIRTTPPTLSQPTYSQPPLSQPLVSTAQPVASMQQEIVVTPGSSDYFSGAEEYIEPSPYGPISHTFDCCGFVTDARAYGIIDALYWTRSDGVFRSSNLTFIDSFGYTGGVRFTMGDRRDATRGREFSFFHFDPWIAVSNQFDPGGTLLGAIFGSAGGFPDSNFSAFRNSTFIEQFHKTDLLGGELNRTYWGSDVAKAFIGWRYIHFDDQFHMSAANTLGEQGIYRLDTTNNMFGAHVGGELLYDIGYRLSFSIQGKLGGYINAFKGRAGLLNAGTQYLYNERNTTDWSGSAELGGTVRFKLSPNVRFRAGYEAMALLNVYDVESNFSTVVTPFTGTSFQRDNAVFHGASIGFEIYR